MALHYENEYEEEKSEMLCEIGANGEIQQENEIEIVKNEPMEEDTIIQETLIDEMPENKGIQRVMDNPNRRRSLRNEQASTRKIKPAKYDEIFNCYKRKEFKECIIYIDLVAESTKDCIEYQILKATCLIYLNIKLTEAHRILDEILKHRPDNVFSIYAKGLAYYQECRWTESINYFNKAISLDPKGMQRAELLKNLAETEVEKEMKCEVEDDEEESSDEHMDVENGENDNPEETLNASNPFYRFGCDICGKRFGKKFNLDRHNKALHNRVTPYIPPLSRNNSRKSAPPKLPTEVKIKEEILNEEEKVVIKKEATASPPAAKKNSQLKMNFFGKKKKKGKKAEALPNGMARCNICRKVYSRGSLARHQVIHTGRKEFECKDCGKSFYQKSDLQRHETIHSDVFDYECEVCDKKFRIKKNLQVHNKRHHSK